MKEGVDPLSENHLNFRPQSPTITSHPHFHSQPESSHSNQIFQPQQNPRLYHHQSFSNNSSQNAIITSPTPLRLDLSLGLNYNYSGEHAMVQTDLGLGLRLGFGNGNDTHHFVDDRGTNFDEVHEDDDNGGFGGVNDFNRSLYTRDYIGFNSGSGVNEVENHQDEGRTFNVENVVNDNFQGFQHHYDDAHVVVGNSMQLDRHVCNACNMQQMMAEHQDIPMIDPRDGFSFGGGGGEGTTNELDVENFLNRAFDDLTDFNVDLYAERTFSYVDDRFYEFERSPPTSECVISNLSSVRLEKKNNELICAICMDDDVVLGEDVLLKQLPCSHCFHGECIIPWLRIRNTCPICRNELPTDDAEYEYRKRQREIQGLNIYN